MNTPQLLEIILATKSPNVMYPDFQLNTAKGTNEMEFSDYVDTFFNSKLRDRFYSPAKIHWGIGISNDLAELLSQKRVSFFVDRHLRNNDVVQKLLGSCRSSSHFSKYVHLHHPKKLRELLVQLMVYLKSLLPLVVAAPLTQPNVVSPQNILAIFMA